MVEIKYNTNKFIALCLLMILPCTFSFGQTVRYVSSDGLNTTPVSATSWGTATSDLQGAIYESKAGEQVWVAAGIYKPGGVSNLDRSVSFSMKENVKVFGGFSKLNATMDKRDWIKNKTILSGGIGIQDDSRDNSYHVVSSFNLTETSILDRFYIRDGNAQSNNPEFTYGGGLYNIAIDSNSNVGPVVRNCVFIKNRAAYAGGGVYNLNSNNGGSDPVFENCMFIENSSSNDGAVFNDECSARFLNCIFVKNEADYGGAVYNYSRNIESDVLFLNSTFVKNIAFSNGGTITNTDHNTATDCILINCIVWTNKDNNFLSILKLKIKADNCLFNSKFSNCSGSSNIISFISPFINLDTGNYQLKRGSKAIDSGKNKIPVHLRYDISGKPRVINRDIDIGAYEYQK